MADLREIVLDTETTGLDYRQGDRIIEIGCIELINKIKTDNFFHTYINPQRRVNNAAFNVHGISNEFLKDKPLFSDVAKDFAAFIKDSTLVIHNAKFDIGFINHEFSLVGMPKISISGVVDTLLIARKKYPGASANLDALCKKFNISLDKRDKHGALIDSELLAMVYVELVSGTQAKFNFQNQNVSRKNRQNLNFPNRSFISSETEKAAHQELIKNIKTPLWGRY
ncbi:DNA polymerase III subunit epsilon [Candidatus Bandiella euplotis]|uniref:DNA polymerase III subunit epsilon n=1 Tax=Candidatus Bandiella euplotis TaxID=1664265 RepID=A0ABZ0UIJ6_9RICK|nr:DNA polymerase III subunit epsilon [Candidatus Bandiella woodruffii]WPX95916.1 DNA polymerase III subunit epsilon [Candidatus Bandiella woodruffii]